MSIQDCGIDMQRAMLAANSVKYIYFEGRVITLTENQVKMVANKLASSYASKNIDTFTARSIATGLVAKQGAFHHVK